MCVLITDHKRLLLKKKINTELTQQKKLGKNLWRACSSHIGNINTPLGINLVTAVVNIIISEYASIGGGRATPDTIIGLSATPPAYCATCN
jgi:hypothetical protein